MPLMPGASVRLWAAPPPLPNMIPESQFIYRHIGEDLFLEIVDAIMNKRRSHVLLGARDAGKRYIMHRLPERLEKEGAGNVISIDFHRDEPWRTEEELSCFIEKHLPPVQDEPTLGGPYDTEYDRSLQHRLEVATALMPGMILLASGVDELGPHLSLIFVQVIRKMVQAASPRLTVVLTGEVNFQDLVHGPGSAFENCAQQIVIQGYDEAEFAKVARPRAKVLNITLTDKAVRQLFLLTGGQLHLLLPLLEAWHIHIASHAAEINAHAARKTFLKLLKSPGAYGLELLHHAEDLIGQYPDEWERLESLIQGKPTSAGFNRPGPLEFAGLAVRDKDNGLHFCSRLITRSVRKYFHPRRWGDWNAHLGRWPQALCAYDKIESTLRLRPSGPDDRPVIWGLVRSYGSYLFSLASQPAQRAPQQRQELRCALQRGLQLLLGVSSVTFWRRGPNGWESLAPMETRGPAASAFATRFLPPKLSGERCPPLGWISVPSPHDQECVVALIAPQRDDQPEALMISEAGSGHVLTHERRNLIRELGGVFLRAYEHLSSVARTIVHAEQRRNFEEIAAAALTGIDKEESSKQILRTAGTALLATGYKRLLFSLIDASGTRIKGEEDVTSNSAVDVAGATDYPVDRPDADIQAWVVHHRKARSVADPRREPGVNLRIVEAANMGPFAVLPLLAQNGEAIGTLHIEREDGSLPMLAEVDDFVAFGRRLSQVLERCEQVALYQPALQLLRDPVVIVDCLNRIRFANDAANTEFGMRIGWQNRRDSETTRHVFNDEPVLDLIKKALHDGQRSVRNLTSVGRRERRMTVVAQPIFARGHSSTRGSPPIQGMFLHFRDYHYIWSGYDKLSELNEEIIARGYLERLLELPLALGHQWARLWLCREVLSGDLSRAELDKSTVVGFKSYHKEDPDLNTVFSGKKEFVLEDIESSRAVCQGQVVIYEMVSGGESRSYTTAIGLPVTTFPNPPHSLLFKRKPGDKWINFPLRATNGKMIGMISMDVPDWFRPRNLEDLNQFAQIIGGRLANLLEDRVLKAASNRAISDVSHEVVSRLASFSILVSRFRRFSRDYPEASALTDDLAQCVDRVSAAIRDIKDAYVVPPVEREALYLKRWLTDIVLALGWKSLVTVKEGPDVVVHFDPRHLERCLVEILKNAPDFARENVPIHINIDAGLTSDAGKLMAWIRIQDNGRGIPENKRKLIFEDFYFYRPDGKKGTGLGLTAARKMIEAHGGTITAGGHALEDKYDPSPPGAVFDIVWPELSGPPASV